MKQFKFNDLVFRKHPCCSDSVAALLNLGNGHSLSVIRMAGEKQFETAVILNGYGLQHNTIKRGLSKTDVEKEMNLWANKVDIKFPF